MVTLQIASLKQRESSLRVMIASIIDQVDKIRIMLTQYESVPDWLKDDKIEAHVFTNRYMDGARFHKNETNEGYILFCDDDIKYPADFVQKMISHHQEKGGMVTIMGLNVDKPIKSYNSQAHEYYSAFQYLSDYRKVQIVGMCGALTHSDYFKMTINDVVVMNSDINTSAYCKKNKIPIHVVPHKSDWLEDLMKTLPPDSRTVWNYNKPKDQDSIIVDFVNANV